MLADADEQNRHVGSMDDADEGSDHVADRVALGDDEAIESSAGPEGRVEVPRLCDTVSADESLNRVLISQC
jgi:hypothetical protein